MRFSPRQSIRLLRSQKAGTLIGCLLLVIGIGALVHAGKISMDERNVKKWVSHTAQIQSAGFSTQENDKGVKSYALEVSYIFDWDGTPYKGTRYRLHDKTNSNFDATNGIVQDLLTSKRDGGNYPIFVNPNNPRQSAILNEVHPKAKSSSLFLGVLFSIMGYFTTFRPKLFGRRRRKG